MVELILEEKRKANKRHECNYCNGIIEKGEIYNYTKLKDDDLYEWKSHEKCSFIASCLWNYIDPHDGMTEDDFQQGCHDFCDCFICPLCENFNSEDKECGVAEFYCINKIYELLQTHDFKRVKGEEQWCYTWKLYPKLKLNRLEEAE